MRKKNKILSLLLFTLVLFLFSSISNSYAATNSWLVGDLYLWGSRTTANISQHNLETGLESILEASSLSDLQFEITSIDRPAKRYEAIPSFSNGELAERGFTYAWDDFVDDYLIFGSFLGFNYAFDRDTNETILTGFTCQFANIEEWLLIESEWGLINDDFVEYLDTTKVLASVPNYYEPTNITDVTLGNFLGNATSYKIMGKNSIEKALTKFTDNSKWTFEFDLSGVLMYPEYNSTLGRNQYYPFEVYTEIIELEYNKEGILNTYSLTVETKNTEDNMVLESTTEQVLALGGIKAAKANFAITSFIGGFVVIAIVTSIIYRKKKN